MTAPGSSVPGPDTRLQSTWLVGRRCGTAIPISGSNVKLLFDQAGSPAVPAEGFYFHTETCCACDASLGDLVPKVDVVPNGQTSKPGPRHDS